MVRGRLTGEGNFVGGKNVKMKQKKNVNRNPTVQGLMLALVRAQSIRAGMALPSVRVLWRVMLVPALALLCLQGCATPPPRHAAVPPDLVTKATVVGFSETGEIRYFPRDPRDVELLEKEWIDSWEREKAYLQTQVLPPTAYLAISGGGDNGAFTAGFLNGWTNAGTRPQFKLVTGCSTGALIAPFAFLGPAYDGVIKSLYTDVSMKDIASVRSITSIFWDDALADTTPLWHLIQKYVTQDLVDAIAAEYEKGRFLLILTTDLDAQRPVVWNVTKIAASHKPGALDLVQKILRASAAIPVTFPPVMINVEANGQSYDEMHVDGSTAAQTFLYPAALPLTELAKEHGDQRERKVYILRNARLDPEWAEVERRTLPIGIKAIQTLLQFSGFGDLYRIYAITERDGVDFNLGFIPATFNTPHKEEFDTIYMRALYEVGFGQAEAGYQWSKQPPVLLGRDNTSPGEDDTSSKSPPE